MLRACKFGGSDDAWALGDESERDFQDFIRAKGPKALRDKLNPDPILDRVKSRHRVKYLRTNYSHQPLSRFFHDLLRTDRLHQMWGSIYFYTFHWGRPENRLALCLSR